MRLEYRHIALSGLILLSLSGCKDKICPAFQSFYVLDDRQRNFMFSPFGEDSLPRMAYDVKKSSVGIVSQSPVLPYLQKLEDFKTVDRELLFARESSLDSIGSVEGQIDVRQELGEVSDSTALEPQEAGVEAKEDYRMPEKRNVEQDTYDRLFGEYLKAEEEKRNPPKKEESVEKEDSQQNGPPQSAPEDQVEDAQVGDQPAESEPTKKKGLLGGFGKKKKQQKGDSEDTEEP